MKIIYNKALPPKGFRAINLFGVIFARKEHAPIDKYVINHEAIHTAQMKELLYLPFYILYVLEWLFRILQYKHPMKAYFNISFEREAYENGDDLKYLHSRKLYASFSHLSRRSHDVNLK